jgi:predicted GNAT family N-acyltransferase
MPIRRFLEAGATFGPEDLKIMSDAFEAALRRLGPDGDAEQTKQAVARRIVALARRGEGNAEKLCREALKTSELRPIPA